MQASDFNKFHTVWKELQGMYKTVVTEQAAIWSFQALIEYDLKDIQQAIPLILQRQEYAPKPKDVINIIKEIRGEDDVTLEAKANKFYNELNKDFSIAHDIVTPDQRAVIAFYQCFNDVRDFGNHPLSADPFDRKAFVSAYVRAKSYWIKNEASEHTNVIRGIYHTDAQPPVRFIGNPQVCLEIVKKVYPAEQSPKLLTCSQPKALEFKEHKESEYVSKEEFKKFLAELELTLKGGKHA